MIAAARTRIALVAAALPCIFIDQSKMGQNKKMKMALHELECGDNLAPGQKLIGRVFPGVSKSTTKGQAVVSKYIVTGPAFSNILLMECWETIVEIQSRLACVDGDLVEIQSNSSGNALWRARDGLWRARDAGWRARDALWRAAVLCGEPETEPDGSRTVG